MRVRDAQIDAITILSPAKFEWFQNHMLDDYEFIEAVADGLYEDAKGVMHTLLVLNEEDPHGILVNSEGSAYARYAAYFPYGKDYVNQALQEVALEIVKTHSTQADKDTWVIGIEDLQKRFFATPLAQMQEKARSLSEILLNAAQDISAISLPTC